MTYFDEDDENRFGRDEVVPELKLRTNDKNGDYMNLREGLEECEGRLNEKLKTPGSPRCCKSFCYWIKLVLLLSSLGVLVGVFFKWVGPFLLDKEIIPIINWEIRTFSTPMLILLVFASVALFPVLLLPSSPSMWVAGMTFGYGYGFLLIISAVAFGVSLPFFIGHLFLHKIQRWLEKYPKRAAILRAAGEGDWFHQFKAVTLIRISPFPYIIYNYCAVATNVRYGPYFLGSMVGMVPDVFAAIYTGILIRTLADASTEQRTISSAQIIFNAIGFCSTVAATVIFTVYAKKQLKVSPIEDEALLQ